jgi:hypothetical protein
MDEHNFMMTLPFSDTLAELRRQFAAQLPARIDAINIQARCLDPAAWHPDDAVVLHRLMQNLTISAGIFGMRPLSEAARTVEARLAALLKAGAAPTEAEWQGISVDLERMIQSAGIRIASRPPEPAEDLAQAR